MYQLITCACDTHPDNASGDLNHRNASTHGHTLSRCPTPEPAGNVRDGTRTGMATVYKAEIRSNYNYTNSSWNSAHEQAQARTPLGILNGYSTQEPAAGNRFLIVYVRFTDTGTMAITAPSPKQFVVNYAGKDYPYSPIAGPDVTVGSINVPQYDYVIGTGGVAGFILPGSSNAADGYLIYEVPATIDLTKAALVIALDPDNQAAWALA